MDKIKLISAGLFSAAGIFALISLFTPDWIVGIGGGSRLGLLWQCQTIYNRKQVCFTPSNISIEWLITLFLIFLGSILIATVVFLLICSDRNRNGRTIFYARWIGFVAMVVFCLAAVIFPLGFYVQEIGGLAYQLPNSHQVGLSYIYFVLALWITVVSELFAGKICLPHF